MPPIINNILWLWLSWRRSNCTYIAVLIVIKINRFKVTSSMSCWVDDNYLSNATQNVASTTFSLFALSPSPTISLSVCMCVCACAFVVSSRLPCRFQQSFVLSVHLIALYRLTQCKTTETPHTANLSSSLICPFAHFASLWIGVRVSGLRFYSIRTCIRNACIIWYVLWVMPMRIMFKLQPHCLNIDEYARIRYRKDKLQMNKKKRKNQYFWQDSLDGRRQSAAVVEAKRPIIQNIHIWIH